MQLRFGLLLIAAALAAPTMFAQERQSTMLDDLVRKNTEAKGGAQALAALKALKLTGKLVVNEGAIELSYQEIRKRPGEIRNEASLQGMTAVQAFDGKDGWKISPFQGRKDPEKMSADDTKSLMEEAEIDGPLIDAQAKGNKLEYLGTEDVDGTLAHKIKVVRKNGDVQFVYLDPDAFLEIRILTQRTEHGAQVETETDLGEYEKIGGVFIPFSIESGRKNSPDKQKTVIEKAEPNPSVDDATFRFPANPPKS